MKKSQRDRVERLISRYRVTQGKGFQLRDFNPADTAGLRSEDKSEAAAWLARGVDWLAEQQEVLSAQDRWGVLLVFQAMDAAGKDGTIRHVTSGLNPQHCNVTSFKQPSTEELDHDFLWRHVCHLPARGQIGIFNRSYYEEVLVVKVHREILERQKIPPALVTKLIWKERYEDIRNFEQYLHRNGIVVLKFLLNVSKAEQKRRFMDRLDQPEKNWKFSAADVEERKHWRQYQDAYEQAIRHTAAPHAPWYVVPADNKWFTRLVVAGAVVDAIARLELRYPVISKDERKALARARRSLDAE